MIRLVFVGLVFLLAGWVNISQAQSQDPAAQEVLDKVAAKYKAYKSYKLSYSRQIQDVEGKTQNTSQGDMVVSGSSFRLSLDKLDIICNGSTLWTINKADKEVTIDDYQPGADEIIPSEIFTLYQKGYRYRFLAENKYGNTVFQVVELEPEDRKKEIAKIRLFINRADRSVKKWVFVERGSNYKQVFEIKKFQANPSLAPDYFTFNKAQYKNITVIDNR